MRDITDSNGCNVQYNDNLNGNKFYDEMNSARIVSPRESDDDLELPTFTEGPIFCEMKNEVNEEDGCDDSSYSSYDSSWCSSVVIPVVRPLPRRAPSPTPTVAFQCSGPPMQSASFGCFAPSSGLCGTGNCFTPPRTSESTLKSGLREMNSIMDFESNNINEHHFPLITEQLIDSKVSNLETKVHCIPYTASEDASENCCGSLFGADTNKKNFCLNDTNDKTYTSNANGMMLQYKTDRVNMNRSAWSIRRHARMNATGRRRRRRSPVFDNMPVVPESPTVFESSSDDQSDTDDSPLPLSPPGTEATSESPFLAEMDLSLDKSKKEFETNTTSVAPIYASPIHPCKTNSSILDSSTISAHISNQQYFTVFHTNSFSDDVNIPSIVTCSQMDDDSFSIGSLASHSIFRTEYSNSSHPKSMQNSASKSVSSGSVSLPVMIGPAYKFTPIDRDCSLSDTGSYEKPQYDDNFDLQFDETENISQEHYVADDFTKKTCNNEEWSIFDMPLLLSKTICDWAEGNNR